MQTQECMSGKDRCRESEEGKKEEEEQRVLSSLVENLGDSKVSMKTLFNVCLGMTHGCIYSESSRTRSLETTRK